MIFNTKATQKNDSQKLADISLSKDKSHKLWSDLDESSQATVSGGTFKGTLGNTVLGAGKVVFTFPPSVTGGSITPIEEIGI